MFVQKILEDYANQTGLEVVGVEDEEEKKAKSASSRDDDQSGSDVTRLTCVGTRRLPLEGAREPRPNKSADFPMVCHSDFIKKTQYHSSCLCSSPLALSRLRDPLVPTGKKCKPLSLRVVSVLNG